MGKFRNKSLSPRLKNNLTTNISSSPPLKFYSTSVLDPNPIPNESFLLSLYPITLLQQHSENDKHKDNSSKNEVFDDEDNLIDFDLDLSPHANSILEFLDPFIENLSCESLRIISPKFHVYNTILEKDVDEDNSDPLPDFVDAEICINKENSQEFKLNENSNSSDIEDIRTISQLLEEYARINSDKVKSLLNQLNVNNLIVPFVELNLPAEVILSYNELEENDPQIDLYQRHPLIASEIKQLGVFLDRYDTNNNILCLFVWSTVDKLLINFPCIGLNPYPLCWKCKNKFGKKSCGNCKVAKYCSRGCQSDDWPSHKYDCPEMAFYTEKHHLLNLE